MLFLKLFMILISSVFDKNLDVEMNSFFLSLLTVLCYKVVV